MLTFVEKFEENVRSQPNAAAFFDDVYTNGLTFSRFDEMSARVYAYLKSHGIGREDFVMIDLPRGVTPIVAMIGVLKAGAAFVVVEDTYAPERIAYIRQDCGCKLEIDHSLWEEIMRCEPLAGHEPTGEHDAAFAVYTSGTTGNPKGVLHEYGNISRIISSIFVDGVHPYLQCDENSVAILSPLNFIATFIVIVTALYKEKTKIYVVSYKTIKNPMALLKFFLAKRINTTFLTPSYVRMIGNKMGPFLKLVFVGSEPANNLYVDGMTLVNGYSCSESGYMVASFLIDRPYETCPIGAPSFPLDIRIVDGDGKEVPDGESGELIFENPYVRGYINLPEETAKAFVDGFYHTGDIARKDELGRFVLLGRNNDMIKINGNRIEPAEIEAAFKQVCHLKWAAAKGVERNGQPFLCAYYNEDVEIDPDAVRHEMSKRLPYYMIPAYFIKVDEIPLKATGKLDRKALPEPDVEQFSTSYEAPEGEIEEAICKGFASVLGMERVGRNDDFYEMGGDSLRSIELVEALNLPRFSAAEVFRGRTPAKIAALYAEALAGDDGVSDDEKNDAAMGEEHPLTAEQLYMLDYQLYTPLSTMYNLFSLMRFDKGQYDMRKLADAVAAVVRNHPALNTRYFFNGEGNLVQKYFPPEEDTLPIGVITEEELGWLKDHLVRPYKMMNAPLCRVRLYETEKAGYLFFDVHHSLFDGTSMQVLFGNIMKAYMDLPLEKDYYYLALQKREDAVHSAFYEESRQYFESVYDGGNWQRFPRCDHHTRENRMGELITPLEVSQVSLSKIETVYRISRNEFFITAAGLAVSIYNKANNIKLSWIYNGREDKNMLSSVGLLFRDLPVCFRFQDKMTLRDVYDDVREQVKKGIEHSCYPYVDMTAQAGTDQESAYVLYQRDIRDNSQLEEMGVENIDLRQNQAASQSVLDMEILDGSDGLQLMIDYAASRYEQSSMERYKDLFIHTVVELVRHDDQSDVTVGELKKNIQNKKGIFQSLFFWKK